MQEKGEILIVVRSAGIEPTTSEARTTTFPQTTLMYNNLLYLIDKGV